MIECTSRGSVAVTNLCRVYLPPKCGKKLLCMSQSWATETLLGDESTRLCRYRQLFSPGFEVISASDLLWYALVLL